MITEIELFTSLKDKLGEQQAKLITEYIDQRINDSASREKDRLATKVDLAELKADLTKSIYYSNVVQLIAILCGVITIFSFMTK